MANVIKTDSLISVIKQNKQKKVSATKIIETNPADLPVVSKLVADKQTTGQVDSDSTQINRGLLENIHRRIVCTKNNNKSIIELFPDIELAIQILVSSILSPKKMTDVQLNYRLLTTFEANPELSSDLLQSISGYIEEEYGLEDSLPEIVREALFTSGASPYSIIPEASVDEVINADLLHTYSMEDFKSRVGVVLESMSSPRNILSYSDRASKPLGKKVTAESLVEYLVSESLVHLTDNTGILSLSSFKEKVTSSILRQSIKKGSSISLESIDKVKYLDVFRDRGAVNKNSEIEYIKTKLETKRRSLGRPMVTKYPTESVIPVFAPGNERDHVGYFVILDEDGKPLTTSMNEEDLNRLNTTLHKANTNQTPIQKAYNNLINNSVDGIDIDQLFEMYKSVLERQLFSTIKSSIYGQGVEVTGKNDIYYLMFSRALQEQRTSLLFIPREQMVYFTFQYNELGIGKSLLENLAVQSSLRAILLFAKVMAYAKQSIDVTKVNISLDPNDPDPEKTIEQVQASVLKLRQNFLPLGINNPIDLVNWIQRAGLQFTYENNPRLPEVKIDFENSNMSHTLPDSDLEEDLRKQSIIALGLPPEIIDNSFSPDFARTVVNNNILLSKRVAIYQRKLEKDVTKYISLVLYSDEDIRETLKERLLETLPSIETTLNEEEKVLLTKDKGSFLEYYLDKLADSVYIELPKPENTDLDNLSEEFDMYASSVEKTIESIVSSDIFSEDVAGEMSNHSDTLKSIWKHHALRKWMADNNYLPELLDISSTDREESDGLLENITAHLVGTLRNNSKLLRLMKEIREATDKDLEETMDGEDLEGGEGGGGDYSSGGDDEGSEGEGGGDDFGEDTDDDELLDF